MLIPLEELKTLPANPNVGDVERAVATTGFSRFPVCSAEGRMLGYLHVKDVLDQAGTDPTTPVPAERIRPLPSVSVTDRLDEAMTSLRRAGSHLAMATTPSGEVAGVVALEDLVEEYVGKVRDGTHVS